MARPHVPSKRLVAAARAERARLAPKLERLRARQRELAEECAALEGRLAILNALLADRGGQATVPADNGVAARNGRELRGAAIRSTALAVLVAHGRDGVSTQRAHYRDWYRLVATHGYTVAGADPLATFLTSISRSPFVVRSAPGVYRLDPGRALALEAARDRAIAALAAASDPDSCARLARAIGRLDRQLAEAPPGWLAAPPPDPPRDDADGRLSERQLAQRTGRRTAE